MTREKALELIVSKCNRLWKFENAIRKELPLSDAVGLMYNANLSTSQYQMVRTSFLPHGLIFPTRNNIQSAKKIFHPQIISQEVKSSVHMGELLEETALSLIRVSNCAVQDGDTFKVIGKFGVDGSGSHKLRHQLINENLVNLETPHLDPTKASSFLLTCYCPLEFKVSEHILWENPAPNSTAFA